MSRGELAKLILYMHGPEHVEAADVEAIVAHASNVASDSVVTAAGQIASATHKPLREPLWIQTASGEFSLDRHCWLVLHLGEQRPVCVSQTPPPQWALWVHWGRDSHPRMQLE